jgi:O-antigen ligase
MLLIVADVFFFIMTVLLSARSSMAVVLMLNLVGGFYLAYKIGQLKWFFALAIVLITIGVILVMKVPTLNARVMELVGTKFYFDPAENNANGLTLRLVKWQCSIEGWSTSPVIGVGTGDTQDFLQACYKGKNFWGNVFEYNSHNQFLQTALGLGAIGFLSLVVCLLLPGVKAFRQQDYLYVAFIVILAISFLTESVLERKQGVLFFQFFHSLFVIFLIKRR